MHFRTDVQRKVHALTTATVIANVSLQTCFGRLQNLSVRRILISFSTQLGSQGVEIQESLLSVSTPT